MDNKIGALWLKTSKKNIKFMSGVIELNGVKTNVVVFKNTNKKEDKHPDYEIYESKPMQRENETPSAKYEDTDESDDLPFD